MRTVFNDFQTIKSLIIKNSKYQQSPNFGLELGLLSKAGMIQQVFLHVSLPILDKYLMHLV